MRVEVFRGSVILEFLIQAKEKKRKQEAAVLSSSKLYMFSEAGYQLKGVCVVTGNIVQSSCKNVCVVTGTIVQSSCKNVCVVTGTIVQSSCKNVCVVTGTIVQSSCKNVCVVTGTIVQNITYTNELH
jgi:hypothetical protein